MKLVYMVDRIFHHRRLRPIFTHTFCNLESNNSFETDGSAVTTTDCLSRSASTLVTPFYFLSFVFECIHQVRKK